MAVLTPKQLEEKSTRSEVAEKGNSLLADSMRKFRQNKMAVLSCLIIIGLYLVSLGAGFLAPYSFDDGDVEYQNYPPTWYKLMMDDDFKSELINWAENTEEYDFSLEEDTEDSEEEEDSEKIERPEAKRILEHSLDHLEPMAVATFFNDKGYWDHLMGTDEIGQDIFSRVIYGMRLSLLTYFVGDAAHPKPPSKPSDRPHHADREDGDAGE